jgi:hypothetical protein
MRIISINNEMPLRISRYRLEPDKLEKFNNGDFARINYKYLFRLVIDKGKGEKATYIELATPSFRQLLYSIRVLWRAKNGDAYDRHNHPVVMVAFDITENPLEIAKRTPSEAKRVAKRFQTAYDKNKGKP